MTTSPYAQRPDAEGSTAYSVSQGGLVIAIAFMAIGAIATVRVAEIGLPSEARIVPQGKDRNAVRPGDPERINKAPVPNEDMKRLARQMLSGPCRGEVLR